MEQIYPAPQTAAANTLILVHGFMDTRRRMGWMAKQLGALGWKVLTPSLQPSNGTAPLERLAEQLNDYIQEHTHESERIDIIGFSMGGLISRYYLQRLNGLAKTDRFITIATPHHGTIAAHFLPFPGTRQMRRKSAFLDNLDSDIEQLQQIVFISYYSPLDLVILPAKSSVVQIARNFKVYALLHPWMIFDPKLLNKIVTVLNQPVSEKMSIPSNG